MTREPIKIPVTDSARVGDEFSIHGRPHIITRIDRRGPIIEATAEETAAWQERITAAPVGFTASLGRWKFEAQPGDSVADILDAVRRMLLGVGHDAG